VYFAGVLIASSWVIESDATTIEVSNIVLDSSLNYEFQVEMFAQEGAAVMVAESVLLSFLSFFSSSLFFYILSFRSSNLLFHLFVLID